MGRTPTRPYLGTVYDATEDEWTMASGWKLEYLYPSSTSITISTSPLNEFHRQPTSRDSGWYKCPYCGRRQNIKIEGGNCISCNGDIMSEVV